MIPKPPQSDDPDRLRLAESEARHRLLFENSLDPTGVVQDGRIVFFNPVMPFVSGYSPEDLSRAFFADLIHPEDRSLTIERDMRRLAGETLSDAQVIRLLRKDGSVRFMSLKGAAIQWEGRPATLNFFSDAARENAGAELEFQAFHDPLTGLPNRTLFADRLNLALARARRHQEPIAILYADLDHLKRVNDTLGHAVGDAMLKEVANRFRSTIRQEDTVARFGGDEFVILLCPTKDGGAAARVAEKLVAQMNGPMDVGGHILRVTTSVGVSVWPTDGEDADTLVKNADKALYQSKEDGRNRYHMFAPAMNERAHQRLALEQSLVKAIEGSEFSLVYQAQHDLRTSRIVGYEALLRWRDSKRGAVPPEAFIPLAEETRLIEPIGDWVLARALLDARRFAPEVRLSVNVSPVQLRDPKFPRRVAELLSVHGIKSQRLELDLSETATLAADQKVLAALADLRGMGVRIAVDDFGTGYASLAHLRRLAVDVVKIDKSFIAGVGGSAADSAIVLGIVGMAHALNLLAVAEGVETEDQKDFLTVAGCDLGQGFLLGRPAPIDELDLAPLRGD